MAADLCFTESAGALSTQQKLWICGSGARPFTIRASITLDIRLEVFWLELDPHLNVSGINKPGRTILLFQRQIAQAGLIGVHPT
jgi:hypothetical protein